MSNEIDPSKVKWDAAPSIDPRQVQWDAPPSGGATGSWTPDAEPMDLVKGAKSSFDRAALGVKGLLPQSWQDAGDRLDRGVGSGGLTKETAVQTPDNWVGTTGAIGADVGMSLAPISRAAAGAKHIVNALRLGKTAAPIAVVGADVAANAAYSAATAPEDRGTAAAWGAGGATAGRALAAALRGPLSKGMTPEARAMTKEGVVLTPGQAMGKDSWLNRVEQAVESNPLTLGTVSAARRRGVQEANINAINSVVKQVEGDIIGRKVPVQEALDQGYESVGRAYQNALDGAKFDNATNALEVFGRSKLDDIFEKHPLMVPNQKGELLHYVGTLGTRLPKDMVAGDTLKQIDSELGYMARQLEKSLDPRDKIAAPAWRDFQHSWRDKVISYAQTDDAKRTLLSAANTSYRELLALSKAKGTQDFVQPRRLKQTLRSMQFDATDPLATQSRNMEATLPNTMGNSGTAERLLVNALPAALMGGGAGLHNFGDPWGLGTTAMVAGAMTSRPGSRYMTGGVSELVPQVAKNAANWVNDQTLVRLFHQLPATARNQILSMAPKDAGEAMSALASQMGRALATQQR